MNEGLEFVQGEILKCVRVTGVESFVTEGHIYVSLGMETVGYTNRLVALIDDSGRKERFYPSRFISVLKP